LVLCAWKQSSFSRSSTFFITFFQQLK
jgi:hypothetical protein